MYVRVSVGVRVKGREECLITREWDVRILWHLLLVVRSLWLAFVLFFLFRAFVCLFVCLIDFVWVFFSFLLLDP